MPGTWTPGPGPTSGNDTFNGDGTDELALGGDGNDTLNGNGGRDSLYGQNGVDTLYGGDGDDTLDGGAGDDTLVGGLGNDYMEGYTGADQLIGGAGNDLYIVDNVGDVVTELAGEGTSDQVVTTLNTYSTPTNIETVTFSGTGSFTGTGTNLGERILGAGSADIIHGLGGDDWLQGNAGNDMLEGGAGADLIEGGDGDDTLYGGQQTTAYNSAATDLAFVAPILDTGTEHDSLNGGNGSDTIFAGYGDTVDGGANGTAGDYLLISFQGATAGVTFDFRQANPTTSQDISNIEFISWVQGSDFNDTINVGTTLIDDYNATHTVVQGMGGNDTLVAGRYTSAMTGDDGNDTLDGRLSLYLETLDGGAGNDTLYASDGGDSISGGSGADTLIGGAGDDLIFSGSVSPTSYNGYYVLTPLVADTGVEQDTLTGGGGSDKLFAGYGDNVDGGADGSYGDYLYVSFQGAAAGVTVNFSTGGTWVIGGGTITGVENIDWIQGSNFDDDITGGYENAYTRFGTIYGMGGNDHLKAGYFTKWMYGGDGADVVDGRGSGYLDIVDGGDGDDTLYTDTNTLSQAFGGAGNDTIYSHYRTYGGDGNDHIFLSNSAWGGIALGEAGDDDIHGADSDTTIAGGDGADTITGGAGADWIFSGNYDTTLTLHDTGLEHDVVSGGGGNDILSVGYGDNADGGAGTDKLYLSLAGATSGVTLDTTGIASGGTTTVFGGTIAGIETLSYIWGTGFADTFTLATQATTLEIETGAGNDTVTASLSAVIVHGGDGNDAITGGRAGDTIYGDDGNDILNGFEGADILYGGNGDDSLTGDSGNAAQFGADTMYGGAGNDTYFVNSVNDAVVENPNEGADTIGTDLTSYSIQSLVNFENLRGYASGSTLVGNAGNNTIEITGGGVNDLSGLDGNDTLIGNSGDDTLRGGNGDDQLRGNAGADTMIGGAGDDYYYVRDASDQVVEAASEGQDAVIITSADSSLTSYTLSANVETLDFTGAGVNFHATGNASDNSISTDSGNDTLEGFGGDDSLNGRAGADTMIGGDGNDTYVVDNAGDVVTELANQGQDLVYVSLSSFTLAANVENLTFIGAGAFAGTGNALNNIITGGNGIDTLTGGAGDDTYVINSASDVVIEAAGEGLDTVQTTGSSFTLGANVENLTFTGSGSFTGVGNGLANVIVGGNGDDTLDGGAGADTLTGGFGNDTYVVDNVGDVVVELSGGADTVQTTLASYTLGANLENLTFTGTGDFSGSGNTLANALTGGAGNDTLDGGSGADTMIGGTGNDAYLVDNSLDVVVENVGAGTDTIRTTLSAYTLGANFENLTYTGSGAFTGVGNVSDNILTGGSGIDTLLGGAGNDIYVINSSGDIVVELSGEGTDTVQSTGTLYTLSANVENLVYTGSGAFTGTGNSLANVITGGSGDDTLNGMAGADTMSGGSGNDIYVVDNVGDVITESSNSGTDTVRTSLSTYTLGTNLENLEFVGSGSFIGIGNSVANSITGGAGNDTLTGGAGNDTLTGGGGTDTAIFSGARSNYTVTNLGSGHYQVTDNRGGSPDGVDQLYTVERAQFSDQTMTLVQGPDVPEDTSTTYTLSVPGTINQTWETTTDGDLFRVSLIAGHTYVFSLNGVGDPLVALYAPNLSLVAYNDDDHGLNSLLTYTATSSGTYYIDAIQFGGVTGDYTLQSFDVTIGDPIAGSTATSSVLTVNGASISSNIDYNYDHDWFRVTLTAGQNYVFSVNGAGGTPLSDPYLELRDASGNLIALDDDGGAGTNAMMQFTATTSGAYYLDVQAFSNETGGYTVSAATGAPQNPLDTLDLGFTINHTNISVYFAISGQNFSTGEGNALRSWTAQEIAAANAAFAAYAAVTGLSFTIVGSSVGADFVMSLNTLPTNVLGLTYPGGATGQAILEFDPLGVGWSNTGGASMAAGGYGFVTLVHEIGHALGLDHPHYDGGDVQVMQGVIDEFFSYGTFQLDQGVFTTMGYNPGWPLGPNGLSPTNNNGWQEGPSALDIAALQNHYGANATTNGGADNYALAMTNTTGTGYTTIWDTGGADTISYSGSANAVIDLRAATLLNQVGGGGYVSYVTGIYGGYTIANGVVIENASGGSGKDTITGNAANNTLSGNIGADFLDGAAGDDTLNGGADNDVLRGGVGLNSLDGGTGLNTADFSWTSTGVLVDLGAGSNQATSLGGGAEAFTDQIVNVQSVLGGTGADTEIFRSVTPGTLLLFDGGVGTDLADFSNFTSAVAIQLSYAGVEGWTRDNGGISTGTWRTIVDLNNVENIRGSAFDDYLQGNGADNTLYYTGGHDLFDGMGGSGDTVDFSAFGSAVYVDLGTVAGGYTRDGANVLSGTWRAIADIANVERLVGTAFDDQLLATGSTRALSGGNGNDYLFVRATSAGIVVSLDGGAGIDVADFSTFSAAVYYANNEAWTRDTADTSSGTWRQIASLTNIESIVGSAYDDRLIGDNGNNTFVYTGGSDQIAGQGGVDTLDFSRFGAAVWINLPTNELYTKDHANLVGGTWRSIGVATGIENLIGTSGADYLHGDANANVLDGGAGDDYLVGGGGADTLIGGAGVNTTSYAESLAAVTVNLSTGAASGGDAAGDILSGIQNLTGSNLADNLTGTTGANVLDGGAGADTLTGLGGDDIYVVDNVGDTIVEASNGGTDMVLSSVNTYTLGADVENYQYIGSGSYAVTGNGADNTFFVGKVAPGVMVTINGLGGADAADFSTFNAAVYYAANEVWTRDTTNTASGTWRQIATLTGVESIIGSSYDDRLIGDNSNNTFVYTGGVDQIAGQGGADTLDFSRFGAAVMIDLPAGELWTKDHANLVGGTWRSIGVVSGIENVTGTGGADYLRGDGGANVLDGGAGDDWLIGGAGADTLIGGAGVNTTSYAESLAAVTVNLSTGAASGGDAAGDILSGIQNLIGSNFADTITGTTGANVLNGGAGADSMTGLAGDDIYYVDNGGDTIVEASNEGTDSVISSVNAYTLGANVENYQYVGAGSYAVTGNGADNTFFVGTIAPGALATINGLAGTDAADFSTFSAAVYYAANEAWTRDTADTSSGTWRQIASLTNIETIVGSAYDDRLIGDNGNNTFVYTGGSDQIAGQGGTDTLDFSRFGVAVWINLPTNELYTKDHANLVGGTWRSIGVATGIENLIGTSGADYLHGDANANVLDGGAGDDYLVGGGGADDFLYHASTGVIAAGHDTIADFARGLDHIELDTALSAGAAAAALHIDISTADSLVTFDGSPDFLITVAGVHLDQSDFLFT